MTASRSHKKSAIPQPETHDLEGVLQLVRTMWEATDRAESSTKPWLQNTIVDSLERLKRQIEGRCKIAALTASQPHMGAVQPIKRVATAPAAATVLQRPLFQEDEESSPKPQSVALASEVPRFPDSACRVYAKELVPQALKVVPQATRFSDINNYRKHLSKSLPFNAVATRRRNANYLISRFFPGENLHRDLVLFASAAEGHRCLGDVLFYLTCRTEKMVAMVAESLIWPSLADGSLPRSRIQDFIKAHFPKSKSAKQVSSAIVRTYSGFGVASATRTQMTVSQRQGHLAAFAYVLHLEYPEPSMYSFERLLDGPMHKWLLWDRQWIIDQLYLARHAKLLSKVSQIDSLRQFTTKYTLAEAVEHIVPLLKEGQS